MHAIEMASCGVMYLTSFVKIGTGVQGVLRFCFRNMKACNDGITDGQDL
jgi:hypothetical protein